MIRTPYNSCAYCGNFLSPDAIIGYGQCYNCGALGNKAKEEKERQARESYRYNDDDDDDDDEEEEEEAPKQAVFNHNGRYRIVYDHKAMANIDLTVACNEMARLLDMNPVWLKHIISSNLPFRSSLPASETLDIYWKLKNNGFAVLCYEEI
jgi:DNA-directed RNA polymerase subunit M/transcription elongation factor TFIIS